MNPKDLLSVDWIVKNDSLQGAWRWNTKGERQLGLPWWCPINTAFVTFRGAVTDDNVLLVPDDDEARVWVALLVRDPDANVLEYGYGMD